MKFHHVWGAFSRRSNAVLASCFYDNSVFLAAIGLVLGCTLPVGALAADLTLESAVAQAQAYDPWLDANRHRESSAVFRFQGAAELPDPKISLGLLSLPTDTFDLNQEAMTQLNVGLSQRFPRGSILGLSQKKMEQNAQLQPVLRQERQAQTRLTVTKLWLVALKAQLSIELITENRRYFEQLRDIATSNYSYLLGGTRQQDLIQADVELTQLDDRTTELERMEQVALAQLMVLMTPVGEAARAFDAVAGELPVVTLDREIGSAPDDVIQALSVHPAVMARVRAIEIANTDTDLAKQMFKPEWAVNTSYGVRGNDAMGRNRADLISVGVSVDLPLFSSRRQTSELKAAYSDLEAVKSERLLVLRELSTRYESLTADLKALDKRRVLYTDSLLPGLSRSADAATNAYGVDNGRFSDVVQARIKALNAKLTALSLDIERQQTLANMNYLLTQFEAVTEQQP